MLGIFYNTIEIRKMCVEIYRDIRHTKQLSRFDEDVYNAIIHVYMNKPEIDYEEVKMLWVGFLTNGSLDFPEVIQHGNKRCVEL